MRVYIVDFWICTATATIRSNNASASVEVKIVRTLYVWRLFVLGKHTLWWNDTNGYNFWRKGGIRSITTDLRCSDWNACVVCQQKCDRICWHIAIYSNFDASRPLRYRDTRLFASNLKKLRRYYARASAYKLIDSWWKLKKRWERFEAKTWARLCFLT